MILVGNFKNCFLSHHWFWLKNRGIKELIWLKIGGSDALVWLKGETDLQANKLCKYIFAKNNGFIKTWGIRDRVSVQKGNYIMDQGLKGD